MSYEIVLHAPLNSELAKMGRYRASQEAVLAALAVQLRAGCCTLAVAKQGEGCYRIYADTILLATVRPAEKPQEPKRLRGRPRLDGWQNVSALEKDSLAEKWHDTPGLIEVRGGQTDKQGAWVLVLTTHDGALLATRRIRTEVPGAAKVGAPLNGRMQKPLVRVFDAFKDYKQTLKGLAPLPEECGALYLAKLGTGEQGEGFFDVVYKMPRARAEEELRK